MEETPFLLLPEEDDDEDDEQATDRKKRSLPSLGELLKYPTKDKETVGQNIADTLLGRRDKVNTDDEVDNAISLDVAETDKNVPQLESEELQLNEEQTADINQRIAQEHLEYPVTAGSPQEPVINFLELVKKRVETETAFKSTIINHGLESPKEPLNQEVNAPQDHIIPEVLPQPFLTKPVGSAQPEGTQQGTKVVERKLNQTPSFASELAKLVINHPSRVHNNSEVVGRKQARAIRKIEQMESNLTSQENALQKLSLEKFASVNPSALKERTQPGRQESRLGLKKPERAEHIGKVVVKQERTTSKHSPENSMKQAKTMHRAELLEISERIKVEGASLRHMFDNNLFGEGALRRLVGAYLEGRELQPLLRREILERQIDYERDPLLRDRGNSDGSNGSLFDKMLAASPEPVNPNLAKRMRKRAKLTLAHDKPEPKIINQTKYLVNNIILGATIAALIGAIIYLLVR